MSGMRLSPRTLAGQAVALALSVVVVIVVAGSVLAAVDARADADDAARSQVTAVAVSLADAPSTAAALTSSDPTAALQPVTERVRAETGIAFITVMRTDGIRVTHTNPAFIGRQYLGSREQALNGEIYTETYTGTLGPSIRTIAPVRTPDGRIVGMVAAGITQNSLSAAWRSQLPLIVAIALAAVIVAFGGLWWIRRRLLRQTGGLGPAELRVMYEHHDAVLHAVREGLVVLDRGRVAVVNDEARRLLALPAEDVPADSLPAFLARDYPTVTDELFVTGGRVLVVNRTQVAGQPDSAVVTIRDRTELSAAVGELDSMTRFAEALRSQAHETANRLHTIVALVEMGRGADAVRFATTELEMSQHLVDRMSTAVGEPALAALLLGKSAQAAERGVSMSLTEESQVSDSAIEVLTTGEMITVVGNLIDNALDACDTSDPWIEVTVVGDRDGVRIVVADSGSGMDPEIFDRARQRGYSTKPGGDAAGRGLGLALVSQVVARRHGTITAENTYGSVVSVTIPGDPTAGTPAHDTDVPG